jgi:hypothetical protein
LFRREKEMNCPKCDRILDFMDEKGKGICVGLRKIPNPKNSEDIFVLCFLKSKVKDRYLLKPSEALAIATGACACYEVYVKRRLKRNE